MSSSPLRRRRAALHLILILLLVCAAIGAAGYAGVRLLAGAPTVGDPRCVVSGADGKHTLTPEQTANASLISAAAVGRGLDHRASVVALATARQESGLVNLDHGDRDSLGLFQQRPSQGWGSPEQVMDPHYATAAFYNHLEHVDYHAMAVTEAAQAVQQSGVPDGYAKHEAGSTALSDAFVGTRAEALNCLLEPVAATAETPGQRAQRVAEGLTADYHGALGAVSVRGGGVVADPRGAEQGWAGAHWAVANAQRLGITRVSYGGRTWDRGAQAATRLAPAPGWQATAAVVGESAVPRDAQLVIDVARG